MTSATPRTQPDAHLEHELDEFEERIERLGSHLDDAHGKLAKIKRDGTEPDAAAPPEG